MEGLKDGRIDGMIDGIKESGDGEIPSAILVLLGWEIFKF